MSRPGGLGALSFPDGLKPLSDESVSRLASALVGLAEEENDAEDQVWAEVERRARAGDCPGVLEICELSKVRSATEIVQALHSAGTR